MRIWAIINVNENVGYDEFILIIRNFILAFTVKILYGPRIKKLNKL